MPHPTRQVIARWAAAVLLTLVVVYPLSYAPVVLWQRDSSSDVENERQLRTYDGSEMLIYTPLDWFLDETPLKQPLFIWARVWGVKGDFEWAMMIRRRERMFNKN